ncbi:MAG: thiamine diphosphokinase [Bulleidia sp.]
MEENDCDWIGADKGALILARHGIHMVCAIGDFDSIDRSELSLIEQYSEQTIVLNPIKDDSDSEAAITKAIELGYDVIEVIGGLGGRMDHTLVNLRLALKYAGKVTFRDARNRISALPVGTHVLTKDDWPYLSFFTESESVLTLQGFAYPLQERTIHASDLYTVSNELVCEKGTVTVQKNPVLLIRSRD